MKRPWFWNMLLILVLAVTGIRLLSSLNRPAPVLPESPQVSRDPGTYPLPPPPPEAASYVEIASRNLFGEERGKVEPPTAETPAAPPPKDTAPPKATLFGVVIEEDGDIYAFLADTAQGAGEKPKKYRAGDSFSGATIKEVRPDRVVFSVGSTEHTVALRTPKEGLAPLPTAAPAGSRAGNSLPNVPRRRTRQPPAVPAQPAQSRQMREERRGGVRSPRVRRPSTRRGRSSPPPGDLRYQDPLGDSGFQDELLTDEEDVYYDETEDYFDSPDEETW